MIWTLGSCKSLSNVASLVFSLRFLEQESYLIIVEEIHYNKGYRVKLKYNFGLISY